MQIEDILRGLLFNQAPVSSQGGMPFGTGEPPPEAAPPQPAIPMPMARPAQAPQTFEDRWAPQEEAIQDGTFAAPGDSRYERMGYAPQQLGKPPLLGGGDLPPEITGGRSPVPVPQPRPPMGGGEGGGMPGMPMPLAPQGAPPAMPAPRGAMAMPGTGGMVQALTGTPNPMQMFLRGMGGLADIKSTGKFGSFARGMGGGIRSGAAYADLEQKRALEARDQDIRMRGQDLTYDVAKQNADSNAAYREGRVFNDAEKNWLKGQGLDITRRKNESDEQYRERMLEYRERANTARNARGKWTSQNWTITDENGNPVSGVMETNTVTGEKRFNPGENIAEKGNRGGAAGRQSAFKDRLAVGNNLYGEGTKEAADYAAGKKMISPLEAMDKARARATQQINNSRQMKYKKPAEIKQAIDALTKEIFEQYERVSRGGWGPSPAATQQQPTPPAPAAPATKLDPKYHEESRANARAYIAKNPGKRDAVLRRLEANNVPTDGL